jgi:hypothetical protein
MYIPIQQKFLRAALHLLRVCFPFSTLCFQAAVYGIGICAEFGGSAFRPHTGGMC